MSDLYPFKYYSAGHLIFLAKEAYKRTISDDSDQASGKNDAIVAIVFAAISLEAFINEITDMALTEKTESYTQPEIVKTFATKMSELEESKGSIRSKFLLASTVFDGKAFNTNSQPYQSFSSLFTLRDALVHMKPREEFATTSENDIIRIKTPKVLTGLPKNILAKGRRGEIITSWTGMISTRAVAKWACNTAVLMVHAILDMLPDSHFKKQAEHYRITFSLL